MRLQDEAVLIELAEAVFQYFARVNEPRAASAVALLHCEHIYYKHDSVAAAVARAHIFNKTWVRHCVPPIEYTSHSFAVFHHLLTFYDKKEDPIIIPFVR